MTVAVRKIVNFILFQAAWFAAVLGAGNSMPWLGVISVLVALAVHVALSGHRITELLLALCAAVVGLCVDSVLVAAGAFSPVPYLVPVPLSPPWMVMLWVNLATTLNVSLGWLRSRYALSAILGAVGGPMAYYSGAKLGAMTRLPDPAGLLAICFAWTIAFPLLLVVNDRLRKRALNS